MTQMMRVYRIQDQYGTGPYRRKIGTDTPRQSDMDWKHSGVSTHPTEGIDFFQGHQPGERFAFDNMNKLMAWFGPYLGHLLKNGYEIAIYEVPKRHVRSGRSGKQVMFQSRVAKKVAPKRKKA